MNGLDVRTVIPGRNNVPGVYSSNFDPTAYSTMPMLTRLAIGSILIQNANFDSVTCTETCTLALWIKTCPADCADSTWQSINLGPVVLPPDVHCVAGSLTAGNILVLNLNDGSQIQVDLSALATDIRVASMALGAGNILTATLSDGSTVTVDLSALATDKYLSSLALGAGNILTGTLNDGSTVTADLSALAPVVADGVTITGNGTAGNPLVAVQRVPTFGVSPLVINPSNGAQVWNNGQTESTPITTLTITNPDATQPRVIEAKILHIAYARQANQEGTKTQAFSLQSLISFDNGSGVLQLASLNPNYLGANQIICQAVMSDVGQNAGSAGNETYMTGVCYIPLAAGATITLRAQSTLTVHDSATNAIAWTLCQLSALILPA